MKAEGTLLDMPTASSPVHACGRALLSFVLAGTIIGCANPPRQIADRIVLGDVWTADPQTARAGGFAIRDGRIAAVGSREEIAKWRSDKTEVTDVGTAFVTPGFGDAHIHFLGGSLTLDAVTLDGVFDLKEIQRRIAAYARTNPARTWITGRGWMYSAFPGDMPHKKWLDEVVPDRPAFITGYDGHTGWANSKALAAAGITRKTADPENGVIVRDAQGEPTGALKEAAQRLVRSLIPAVTEEEKYQALKRGMQRAASFGLTFAHNAGFDLADLPVYERLLGEGALKIRFYNALGFVADPDEARINQYKQLREKYQGPMFRFGAIKAMADGVVESHTAAMFEPFVGGGPRSGLGIANYEPAAFEKGIAAFDRAGFQIFTHAIGDRAIRMTLDAYEKAARANGTSGRRHRIEHVEVPDFSDLRRFKSLGVIASTQAMFATPDANTLGAYAGALGAERAKRAMAFKEIDDLGIRQAFGSDWPVFTNEVLQGIHCAVTRTLPDGTPQGGWQPQSRISAEAALRHFTVDGAYAGFAEDQYGTIAAGRFADFVVLSQDITKVPVTDILKTKVLLTALGGRDTFRASQ